MPLVWGENVVNKGLLKGRCRAMVRQKTGIGTQAQFIHFTDC